jgi:toxin-antitoxin system PIN domain toxin
VRSIVDANVLLSLLTEGHAHRAPAVEWWDACNDADVGLSLPVHMAMLRLLSNIKVMGSSVLRPAAAWSAVRRLIADPRIEVLDQVPAAHSKLWYDNAARREPLPDPWTDAWLAALAQAHDCEMVTFDRGFRSFSKLKLRLLEPAS